MSVQDQVYKPKIGVFGTNGQLGTPIIKTFTSEQFQSRFNLPIVAITRDKSQYQDNNLVIYKESDIIKDPGSFTKALKGLDVLINVASTNLPLNKILASIIEVGTIKLYIPSQFGLDIQKVQDYLPIFKFKMDHSNESRSLGIKTVNMITPLFAVPNGYLYEWIDFLSYDAKRNVSTLVGDPDLKFSITKSLVTIVTKKPNELPDSIRIFSDLVSQETILKRYEETHNLKIKREHISKDKALKKAQELLSKGFSWDDFFFFLQVIALQGPDRGLAFSKDDRELINPKETVFHWEQLLTYFINKEQIYNW
ncbi:2'-hydroxyisoflavone reductase [Ascoidea rubescens DSM 1968]|uniref:2'-hydroxyisoflavone reductase n=1 Tax=Ascoidea rubescens DSM 1968 TaxID=1344418 RepID=A0A1D2VJ19_9ASCO|nr:2'-hydroxyisoflavone reductase [Ascoidea rubescens DSM 1968]ODV61615.1 2'-hydroxyisoflavone reductase [Ascoidea rubescens DSM 1968]